jgi:membrane-bound lytic murein transglycosylase D
MFANYIKRILLLFSKHHKVVIAFWSIVFILAIASLLDYFISQKIFNAENKSYYKVFNVRVPKELFFASTKVPVHDEVVRKALAREMIKNTYWKQQARTLQYRTNKWFPVIEPILKKYHVPDDFKYIAVVESHLTNVESPRGAVGFWQIIRSTGESYGLEINEHVDERLHVVKSTVVACQYFVNSYNELNDWVLVAASYNKGVGGIRSQLTRQKKNNYYKLKLNKETGTYVYKIIAMKELISMPKVYGLNVAFKHIDRRTATKKITIDSSINDLRMFALERAIDYERFKELNPWLKSNQLPNEAGKKYTIEL